MNDLPTTTEIEPLPAQLAEEVPARAPGPVLCRVCSAPNPNLRRDCEDCGYHFSPEELVATAVVTATPPKPAVKLQGRYEVGQQVNERLGVVRYKGLDHGVEGAPVPIYILQQAAPEARPPPPSPKRFRRKATSATTSCRASTRCCSAVRFRSLAR